MHGSCFVLDLYGTVLARVLFPAFESARGRPTVPLLRELEASQWTHDLRDQQLDRLHRLLRQAHQTTHYRAVFEDRGFDPQKLSSLADLHRLPLLDRATVRSTLETRTAATPAWEIEKSTSGTTGDPVVVRYDAESRHWRDATRWRGYGWAGYRIGMRALHYWGIPPDRPSWLHRRKLELDHLLKRDHHVDCIPRDEASLAAAVDEVRRFQPQVIVAYTSGAATLARFVTEHDLRTWTDIPVIVGAERLWPHDRAAIETAFGPVFETYGSREVMLIGAECELHVGLHVSMENLIVELVVREADGTTRAAAPGETGEVVITDLHNLACPMIRYLNGDLAVARPDTPCACGRRLDRIGPIEGRLTETLHDGDGNPVGGLVFNILFGVLDDVAQLFQVVQHRDGSIVMKVVPTGTALPESAERAVRAFAARYLRGVRFAIEYVDHIPLSPSGKRNVVVVDH